MIDKYRASNFQQFSTDTIRMVNRRSVEHISVYNTDASMKMTTYRIFLKFTHDPVFLKAINVQIRSHRFVTSADCGYLLLLGSGCGEYNLTA